MRCLLLTLLVGLPVLAQVMLPARRIVAPFLTSVAITNELVAYWQLEESSGTRADSGPNNYDLAEGASPTNQPGPIDVGDGVRFNLTNSEYLWIADQSGLSMGAGVSFEIVAWFKARTIKTNHMIVSKWDTVGPDEEYQLYIDATPSFQWAVRDAANSATTIQTNTFSGITTQTWFFVDCWYDADNDELVSSVNLTDFVTNSYAGDVRDGAADFRLGARDGDAAYFDGTIDQVGVWKRILTSSERSSLYAAGAGLSLYATPPIAQAIDFDLHITNGASMSSWQSTSISEVFPSAAPTEDGVINFTTSPVAGLTNLASVYSISMTGYTAVPILWVASTNSGTVMIAYQGHDWTYNSVNFPAVLQDFLNNKISVAGLVMPDGANTLTSGSAAAHNASMHPVDEFLGPVAVVVNNLEAQGYTNIFMTGLSGGGWATSLYPGLDERILKSYPISGSLPLFDEPTPGGRDWEQEISDRGLTASYLDYYLLATSSGRRALQILYFNDACCFGSGDYFLGWDYDTSIESISLELGGQYDLVWADKSTHQWYTDVVDTYILPELPAYSGTPFVPYLNLNTGLGAYWKMDETSGSRVDSYADPTALDLTDNNTVTSNPGIIDAAGQYTRANSEYLSHADDTALSTGSGVSFSFTCWVYFDTLPTGGNYWWIGAKDTSASGMREWSLFYSGDTSRFTFITGKTASTSTDGVTANNFGAASTATWYFVSVVHQSGGQNHISVNAGTRNSAAFTQDPPDTTADFAVGSLSGGAHYFNGRIDEVAWYRKALGTVDEFNLYNAGAGLTCCPFP